VGVQCIVQTTSSSALFGLTIVVERLSAEGGVKWERVYGDMILSDPEVGYHTYYAQCGQLFDRYPSDPGPNRFDIETSRRWHIWSSQQPTDWFQLHLMMTYHAITFAAAGDVSNSGGGTVNLYLHRDSDGELMMVGSRSGNGSYSLTCYDSANKAVVRFYEDSTHQGSSDVGYPA
jgi:hypothetical protein